MNLIPVVARKSPLLDFIPPSVTPNKLYFNCDVIRIPPKVLRGQVYYEIEILPKQYLDGSEKFVIPVNEPILLGFLTSSLFAIWVKGISSGKKLFISDKTMYNNFPFPKISRKQAEEIEKAVNFVFEARAECRFTKLIDVYTPETMPDFLVRAHENLDKVLYDIMGIPHDATPEIVLKNLFHKYLELLNTI